ncbi:hypothetical protein [Pedobacter glucosidilyticus]|uniref:hypothetical protein n=1 Tax=Pedobacter glucosidilyticus TaxID=1122941 RepID=UPI0026F3312E|nr:hypothetical protein [Pedobacter glucosidilyticus]
MKKLIFFLAISGIAIYYIGGYNKPDPKIGEVIFDVPALINKNMLQIMETYKKSPRQYTDSIVSGGDIYKKDENSEYIKWNSVNEGGSETFIYLKDGWRLLIFFKSGKIESLNIAVEYEKFRRVGFTDVNDLLIIGNLKPDAENYKLTFRDWLHLDFELSSENKGSYSFHEVRILPQVENVKPILKKDSVIFDVPHLIDMNIDQLMQTFGKTLNEYKDSTTTSWNFTKSDGNSKYILANSSSQGSFEFHKDGWVLSASFDSNSRIIKYIYIEVEDNDFVSFNDTNDLLIAGNLKKVVNDYKLVFSDLNYGSRNLKSKEDHKYYAVKIYPRN